MTQEELKKLTTEIRQLIKKLEKEIAELEITAAPVKPENSLGRISRMDAINNKSVMEVSIRSRKSKLSKLHAALGNIKKPGFGLCANCKQQINPKRLMLMPQSDRCVRCAGR